MDSVEVTAKKIEDAIKEGLEQLSATLDDVDVKVLDTGGLFRKAKIIMSLTEQEGRKRAERREKFERKQHEQPREERAFTGKPRNEEREQPREQRKEKPKPQPPQKQDQSRAEQQTKEAGKESKQHVSKPVIEPAPKSDKPSEVPEKALNDTLEFLKKVLEKMGVDADIRSEGHGYDLDIELVTQDEAVIGYHGETLDSLEYLAGLVANRDSEKYIKLSMDSNDYRNKQTDGLVKLAEKMASKCIKQGRKIVMEPMNSAARKVIHAVLGNNDKVVTKSEGKEPNRRVVIYCKREDKTNRSE